MFEKILNQKFLIIVVSVLMAALGVFAFKSMSIDAYPDISGVQVQIITSFPGRAAEEVEQQVTIPMERTMAGIPKAESIRSRTIFGLSLVQIVFEPEADDYWARNVVSQKLGEVELPQEASATLASLSTAYGEIYRYELTSKTKSIMELRTVNDWVVTPRLLRSKGVIEVANFGGEGKQYAIWLDPIQLLRFGVRLDDITDAVQVNNSTAGGSFIERGSTALIIRGLGRVKNESELNNIFVKNSNGTKVFIHDLGQVKIDHLPITGIFGKDDRNSSVEGIVRMRRGENPSIVLDHLHTAIDELKSKLGAEDIQLTPFYDRSALVSETLHTVSHNVFLGIVLVILTLVIFLGSLKTSIAVSLAIPFSLLWAFLLMKLTGIPVSLLSIGAVDFGIIVDGAIIMAEGMLLGTAHSKIYNEGLRQGFVKTIRPMIFSMLIIIITYIPLLSLRYIEGLIFKPMAITLCYSLSGALIFSCLVLPVVMSLNIFKVNEHVDPKWLTKSVELYSGWISNWIKRSRAFTLNILFVIVAIIVVLGMNLGTEFLPYMDEGVFWLRANFPEGISLNENSEYASLLRVLLKKIPEVDYVTSQAGRSDTGTDPFPMNRVEMMVGLKDKSQWRSGMNKLKLENEIRVLVANEFPTTRFNLTQPIIDSVTEDTNGTSANLAVEIVGDDLKVLRELGQKIAKLIKTIPGSVNVNLEQEGPQPQLRIDVDHKSLSEHQLSSDSVNNMINTALGGIPITSLYEGERKFNIVVKYDPHQISTPQKIAELPIFNELGEAIPLAQVSNINIQDGETLIARGKGRRRITVRTDIRGRPQGSFVNEAQKSFAKNIELPKGYSVQWLGMFENLERAQKHFSLLIPLTLFLISILLFISLGELTAVGFVFLSIPFSLVGAFLTLAIRSMPLSVSSGVGLASLFGVASMYSILIVASFLRQQTEGLSVEESIKASCIDNFRPVFLTAAVAILGLVPAMLSTGIGSDVQRPIATAIVGGLVSSSILSLTLLPCFILNFYRPKNKL